MRLRQKRYPVTVRPRITSGKYSRSQSDISSIRFILLVRDCAASGACAKSMQLKIYLTYRPLAGDVKEVTSR